MANSALVPNQARTRVIPGYLAEQVEEGTPRQRQVRHFCSNIQ